MSKTEIVTPQVQERQIENQINRAVRHCRIGKVTEKRPRHYGPYAPQPFAPIDRSKTFWIEIGKPLYGPTDMSWLYPHKCGCRPGDVCGNAACPNRMIATSAGEYCRSDGMTTANRLGLDAYGA